MIIIMYQSFNVNDSNNSAENYIKGNIGLNVKDEHKYIEHLCHPDITPIVLPPRVVGNVSTKLIKNKHKLILTTPASGNIYLTYVPHERNNQANAIFTSLLRSAADVTAYTSFASTTDTQTNMGYNWVLPGAFSSENNSDIAQYVGVVSSCLKIEYISNLEQASGLITYFPQISESEAVAGGGEAFAPSSDYDNCIGNMGGCKAISKGLLGKFVYFPISTMDILDFNIASNSHKLVWRICLEGMPEGSKILVEMITNFELHLNTMHTNYNLIREDNIANKVIEQGVWDKLKHNIVQNISDRFINSNALTFIGTKIYDYLSNSNSYNSFNLMNNRNMKQLM